MKPEKIREARKRKGLTQEQLSKMLGVQRSVISKYETGLIVPSIPQLQKIAAALDVSVSSLLYDRAIDFNIENKKKSEGIAPEEFEKLQKLMKSLDDVLSNYHADDAVILLQYYNKLNHKGRKEAIKRTAELSRQEEYTAPDNSKAPK